jgi:hypothetical protein
MGKLGVLCSLGGLPCFCVMCATCFSGEDLRKNVNEVPGRVARGSAPLVSGIDIPVSSTTWPSTRPRRPRLRPVRALSRHQAVHRACGPGHDPRAVRPGKGGSSGSWTTGHRIATGPPRPGSAVLPNTKVVHLPVHASWLSRVEVYFSVIQRKILTPDELTGATASVLT